jgi:hypothetical protein
MPRYKPARTDTTERSERVAERVGFEPTCRLPDKTLSRRPRYDHFGTSPIRDRDGPFTISRQPFRSDRRRTEFKRETERLAPTP